MSDSRMLSAPAVEFVAGSTAGIVSTAVAHPLELVKTRLQLMKTSTSALGYSLGIARSVWHKEGGLRAFYRGISSNLVGNASSWAFYFVLYEEGKTFISSQLGATDLASRHYFLASSVSGVITAALTNPIWVIKTRMLSTAAKEPGAYASTWQGVRQVYRTDGIPGFYRGFVPSLFGVIHGALQFVIYEQLKKSQSRRGTDGTSMGVSDDGLNIRRKRMGDDLERRQLSTVDYLWCSGLSKILAGAATYPYQVVRSRLQMHGAERSYSSARDAISQVWRNEGPLGLYKGLGPNLLRVVPSTCITFVVYESTKKFLQNQ